YTTLFRSIEIFGVILIANVLTMLAMNLFVLQTSYFLPIYAVGLLAGLSLVKSARIDPVKNDLRFSRAERITLLAAYALLAGLYIVPRTSYLLEGFFGYSVDAISWDDYWHLQELNSLINSAHYPAISSFTAGKYLSHYY